MVSLPFTTALGVLVSKDDAAWLIVRTLGVLSLSWGAFLLFEFLLNILVVLTYEPPEYMKGQETIRLPNLNWNPFIGFLFLSVLAIYLLRWGQFFHKILLNGPRQREHT